MIFLKFFFYFVTKFINYINSTNRFFFIINLHDKKQKLYSVKKSKNKDYEKIQINTTHIKLKKNLSYVNENDIRKISLLLNKNIKKKIFGLCHGVRDGKEILYFEKYLRKSDVYGTDIYPNLENKKVFNFNFNNYNKDWNNKFDFIYSNCIDHSNNPKKTISNWIKSIKKDGYLIFDHSSSHGLRRKTITDPCAIETELFPFLLIDWFNNKLSIENFIKPSGLRGKSSRNKIIFCKKI